MVTNLIDCKNPVRHRTARRMPGMLIVDGVEIVRSALAVELEWQGVRIWQAQSGCDAVHLFRLHRDQIDLVLLDAQMPDMDGPEILTLLRLFDSDVPACFMTGGSDRYSRRDLLARGAIQVFAKPCRLRQVMELVESVFAASSDNNASDSRHRDDLGDEMDADLLDEFDDHWFDE